VAVPPVGNLTKEQADNLISYLKTRFVRFLVATKTSTQDMPPKAYAFVPVQNFDKVWTDEELYKKYGLNEHEILGIEEAILEMK
jgi:site-specific DNA-methyltransferase (adenine-specific)